MAQLHLAIGSAGVAIGLAMPIAARAGGADALPAAIFEDPAPDAQYPASGLAVQFRSHGALLNAQIYRPPGPGPHPTAVLLHGLPGNEQNLDLAQALRRAGWTALTFHYTGSWGSAGRFTLRAGIDDTAALFERLRDAALAKAWGVDPERILLLGHSYGGYVAAQAAGVQRGVIGAVLIAPWDVSFDARAFAAMPPAQRARALAREFDDVDGRLNGASAATLGHDVLAHGGGFDLAKLAPALARCPTLVITATRDDEDDKAADFIAAMRGLAAPDFTVQSMDTDHSFNDRRIALEAAILQWAARLPGAAGPRTLSR